MSVNNNKRDFSEYDSMSTEQLEEILRLDAEMPEGSESGTEELFYIMEVLAVRRKEDPNNAGKSAQQAYESFKKHYMPTDIEADIDIHTTKSSKPKKRISWLRGLTAAAAVLAIIILATTTANAFGYDLWDKVAVWSAEIFQFVGSSHGAVPTDPSKQDKLEYGTLQQALNELEITHRLAPTWLPEGYNLATITVDRTPIEISIYALYKTSDGTSLTVSIRKLITSVPEKTEKNDSFVRAYDANGVSYYLFGNHDKVKASWVIDQFECYISGYITIDEMISIIDSI